MKKLMFFVAILSMFSTTNGLKCWMSVNGSPDVGSIKKVENPTVCVYVSICWIINFNRILKKPLECLKSVWMFNY